MYAIVCDKCGKLVLLDNTKPLAFQKTGFHRLAMTIGELEDSGETKLDLCEKCADDLIAAVREEKGKA